MRSFSLALFSLPLAAGFGLFAAAQQSPAPGMTGPPALIQVTREFIKPGKAGAIHDRSESAFVQAMARAKWPTHYFALNSMSGPSRALYFTPYSSFAAWEKDRDAVEKDHALSAELERASVADGELLSSLDEAVLQYHPDLSYQPVPSLANIRYMEITEFKIHPGHGMDWRNLVKMYVDGMQKAGITDATWATFEIAYGGGDEYVLISTDKSLADIDQATADGKKFRDAVGEEGMKKISDLEASCVKGVDSELFAINPAQSYPPPEWVKENPSFWKPKPAMASAAKPGAEKKTK